MGLIQYYVLLIVSAGLDDTVAAGLNGFSTLQNLARHFGDSSLSDLLEKGKRYLKTKFQSHAGDEMSKIKTHNPMYALSDKTHPSLTAKHQTTSMVCMDCFELCSSLDSVMQLAMARKADEDTIYDIQMAINAIKDYIKHQMRDAQQRKAKEECFSKLSDEVALWLKDFSQKILPVQHREGSKEYFGKKGMTLHVDVIFIREEGKIEKKTYYTVIFRCDQGMLDVLSISDCVLDEVQKDFPKIKQMYAKSDNAICYHSNGAAEGLYKLCKDKGVKLLRYDYNEPNKGKDQCDRDSATAKSLLRSYVDSGKDLLNGEDIYNGLHYTNGLPKSKVGEVGIDAQKTNIEAQDIKLITHYHSFQFLENTMVVWRYYKVGQGIQIPYSRVTFDSGANVVKAYHDTWTATPQQQELRAKLQEKRFSKKRQDRQLCNLIFCSSNQCQASFESIDELKEHELQGVHIFDTAKTSMDLVRSSYVRKMKESGMTKTVMSTDEVVMASQISLEEAMLQSDTFAEICCEGWALPIKKKFRFNPQQLLILKNLFIQGEKSKKKCSAEEAVQEIRKQFSPKDYVTVQQVKGLFHRLTKLLKQGKLSLELETDKQLE